MDRDLDVHRLTSRPRTLRRLPACDDTIERLIAVLDSYAGR